MKTTSLSMVLMFAGVIHIQAMENTQQKIDAIVIDADDTKSTKNEHGKRAGTLLESSIKKRARVEGDESKKNQVNKNSEDTMNVELIEEQIAPKINSGLPLTRTNAPTPLVVRFGTLQKSPTPEKTSNQKDERFVDGIVSNVEAAYPTSNELNTANGLVQPNAQVQEAAVFGMQAEKANIEAKDANFVTIYWDEADTKSASNVAFIDLNVRDERQRTYLHALILDNGSELQVSALLDRGADVNAQDDIGQTPLFFAVTKKRIDLVAFLLAKGADVNRARLDGVTPLMAAACKNLMEIALLLVYKGADADAKNKDGSSFQYYLPLNIRRYFCDDWKVS